MLRYLRLFFILICSILLACSPKVRKVATIPTKIPEEERSNIEKIEKKFTEAQIALLIPFKLNELNLKTASKAQLDRANMAIDFYQGLTMGIDSAASLGLNFKINVYDTRDDDRQLANLIKKEAFKNSNLIIGPVFPEGLKYMADYSQTKDVPIVSPLAATRPSEFNNPKLISIVNNINQHAEKIATYIGHKYPSSSSIVVLINANKKEDIEFATPLKAYLKENYPNLIVQEFVSTNVFETRMVKGKRYAVVVCSSDVPFVAASIDKLAKLTKLRTGGYDINVFGHPNWAKQSYNIDNLQTLKTILSSSYFINYRSSAVVAFIKNYRNNFHFEPSEYSFKGFDIGFYFGKLMNKHGENYLDFLTKEKYKGLHHDFEFSYDPLYGYYNRPLMLLQYKDLSLIRIE